MLTLSRSSFSSVAVVAAALFVATTGPVTAATNADFAFETTEDLYSICSTAASDENHALAQTACTAFIEAAVQYHDAVSDRKNLKRLICYKEGTSVGDGQDAFVAWAKKNAGSAKLMGEVPVVGVVRALAQAYPCK